MRADENSLESTPAGLPQSKQDRLAQILDDYLLAAERGAPVSPEELLERYPDEAPYLRDYLSGLALFHNAAIGRSKTRVGSLLCAPHANQVIGDYRLIREIGRGGMGVVYEALQISLQRSVALKLLPFAVGHDDKRISRFRNEAQAAAHVQHPNIVPVYAIGEHEGVHFYAMQLIAGQSLTAMLDETRGCGCTSSGPTTAPDYRRTTGERASRMKDHSPPSANSTSSPKPAAAIAARQTVEHVRSVARLGKQAAEALHAAHDYGVVHRDIKPSNLLVDDQGKLWVTDFGLARCRETSGLTQTGDVLGTMRYMSPEQALGRSALIDHRTDIYSLGVTLYELATLHHPAGEATDAQLAADRRRFTCKPLRHWNPHIPVDFQTIVLKAICEFPHERYATAREFAEDLRRFLEGKPILASPPSLVSRATKWAGRHRSFVAATAAVLVVAFAGLSANMLLLARKNLETDRALVQANDNLRQAHAVLDRFGSQLVDQLAAIPGAEGVRYQLLEDSLEFYQELEQQASGDPSLAADVALALSKMGSLAEKMGDSKAALAKHESARAIWEERVAAEPENLDYARNLALCQNNIGLLSANLGKGDEGLDSLRRAEHLQKRLLAANPQWQQIATDLATTYSNLGLVLRTKDDWRGARTMFVEAIVLQEKLAADLPDSETALRGLAASYNNLASLDESTDGNDAARAYGKAVAIQQRLVERQPINRIYQGDLARTYNNLGYLLARRNDWQSAQVCYGDAIAIQEHLVASSPLAASYRRDLAISYNNLGMAESRGDESAKAEVSFRKAIDLQQLLLAADRSDIKLLSNQGGVFNNLGMLLESRKQYAAAEDAYRQAIRLQRQALDAAPDNRLYRDMLSNHFANFAQCLEKQNKTDAAAEVARERKSLASLAADQPTPVN